MPRQIILLCALTGLRTRLPEEEVSDGEPVLNVDEDLPEGWGFLRVARVVPNPEYAAALEMRQASIDEFEAQVAAAIAAGQVAGEMGVEIARGKLMEQLDQTVPLPPEFVFAEYEYSPLSPEAMDRVIGALSGIGLPFKPVAAPPPRIAVAPTEAAPPPEA